MTNNFDEEPWYPQLPEGYTGEAQGMQGNGMDGWMPGSGMPSYGMDDYMTGMAMPGYDMGYGDYTAQRQPGFPGGGFPGGPGRARIPGGGFPGGPGGPWIPGAVDFQEVVSQGKDRDSLVAVSQGKDQVFQVADSQARRPRRTGATSANFRAAKLHTILSGGQWWSTTLRSRPWRN